MRSEVDKPFQHVDGVDPHRGHGVAAFEDKHRGQTRSGNALVSGPLTASLLAGFELWMLVSM
jgi:hypothetical protein